jgi:phosphocarrier protein HPr
MKQQDITIQNIFGIHARPAARFSRLASKFKCTVEIVKNHETVNGKSILGVMSLAAEKGSVITIRTSGADEDKAIYQLVDLLNKIFTEEE